MSSHHPQDDTMITAHQSIPLKSRREILTGSLRSLSLAAAALALHTNTQTTAVLALDAADVPGARGTIGGLGNLGVKSPALTGVYRSMRIDAQGAQLEPGSLLDELLAADGSPVLVSFNFPTSWKLSVKGSYCESLTSCAPGAIDARELNTGDSAFMVVAAASGSSEGESMESRVRKTVFSRFGKYGAYGAPDEVRLLKKVDQSSDFPGATNRTRFEYSFVTFTPSMRTLRKRCYVTAVDVKGDLFMLVTASNATRWKSIEPKLSEIAGSFRAFPAPAGKKMKRKQTDTVPGLDSTEFVLPGAEYEDDEGF